MFINKYYNEPSVFNPENLLRESRRQKGLDGGLVPEVCILDPDGDIVAYLLKTNQASLNNYWACYHTKLYNFGYKEIEFGIIGTAVGGSFAVLLAEQLFVSGCQLLISVTSAGLINPPANNARFILIEKALRDEGTSSHYLPPSEYISIDKVLLQSLQTTFQGAGLPVEVGDSWTTDAPYRETASSIEEAKRKGVIAVEMEAAALYAYSSFKNRKTVCYAHLTNTMAQNELDFEKGIENGSLESLELIHHTARILWKSSLD
jgi:uridine phosphorylase